MQLPGNANPPPPVRVKISLDGMQAEAMRVSDEPCAPDEVRAAAERAGVRVALDEQAITRLCSAREDLGWVVIARGEPATPGADARIDYRFSVDGPVRMSDLEEDRVDYRQTVIYNNVRAGQVLAVKVPATMGEPGRNVRGEVMPALAGRDTALPLGKNVVVGDDGVSVVASIDGEASLVNNRISVFDVHQVPGDIDYGTGNIDFPGNVVIGGSVKPGFTVKAAGNVTVGRNVESGRIEAGGIVLIGGGLIGRGQVVAGGDVQMSFAENAQIRSGGSVYVQKGLIQSEVSASRSIFVVAGDGVVYGGHLRAGEAVGAATIGSVSGAPTNIEVGIDPALAEQLRSLEAERKQQEGTWQKTLQAMSMLHDLARLPGGLKPEQAKTLEQLQATELTLRNRVAALRMELEELMQRKHQQHGHLTATRAIHAGVHLTVDGQALAPFNSDLPPCTCVLKEGWLDYRPCRRVPGQLPYRITQI